MIILKGEKSANDGLYEHKISDEKSAKGILHAYQKNNKWHFMSKEEYDSNKGTDLPDVCIAFKCPIPNMETLLNGPKPLISIDLQTLVSDEPLTTNVTSSLSD